MNHWKKHVKSLRKEVQAYYNKYQRAQEKVTEAEQAYETAMEEERTTRAKNRERIQIEIAAHNTKQKYLLVQAAKDNLKKVADDRFSLLEKAKRIRGDLSAELEDAFSADPSQVDANTMTLINSGILRASDYERMYNKAKDAGNATMMRLIGKAAGNYAEMETDAVNRRTLNMLYSDSESVKKAELTRFDEYVFMLKSATGNPESVYRYRENPAMFEFFLENTEDGDD